MSKADATDVADQYDSLKDAVLKLWNDGTKSKQQVRDAGANPNAFGYHLGADLYRKRLWQIAKDFDIPFPEILEDETGEQEWTEWENRDENPREY